jgi:hypothetical protein
MPFRVTGEESIEGPDEDPRAFFALLSKGLKFRHINLQKSSVLDR